MFWLDHKIFGNGHGMKTPYCDGTFFWLVDTSESRAKGRGDLYTWIGGHGAQLTSRQWTQPKVGERRKLLDLEFVPFSTTRKGPRVEVSWAVRSWRGKDINEMNVLLATLKRELHAL